MSKRKFNVGDKVQLTPKFQNVYNSIGDKQGEVIEIESNGNRSVYLVSFENKKFMSVYYSYQLDRASKFKKGDKVTFTPQAIQWLYKNGYCEIGSTCNNLIDPDTPYTISNVYKSGGYDGYKYSLVGADCIVATDDDLELYDESKDGLTIDEVMYNPRDDIFFNQHTDRMKRWTDICNEYLKEFCDRHDYTYHPCDWIGGEVGGIIEIADMFVTMDNIRYDVDNNITVDKFSDWYWNSVEHSELGLKYMNYPSYCKGAPDPYTREQIQAIREGQMKIRQAKEDLRKTMDELGGDFSKLLF